MQNLTDVYGAEIIGDTSIDAGEYQLPGVLGVYKLLLMQGSTMAGIKINLL